MFSVTEVKKADKSIKFNKKPTINSPTNEKLKKPPDELKEAITALLNMVASSGKYSKKS